MSEMPPQLIDRFGLRLSCGRLNQGPWVARSILEL